MSPVDTQGKVLSIQIGSRAVGPEHPTYIIAEIGINHNGDPELARRLIDVAAEAKVDAVKFQKRHLPSLYRQDVLTDTLKYEQHFQYMIPILKRVELREEDFVELKAYSEQKGLEFLCTPFDLPERGLPGRARTSSPSRSPRPISATCSCWITWPLSACPCSSPRACPTGRRSKRPWISSGRGMCRLPFSTAGAFTRSGPGRSTSG